MKVESVLYRLRVYDAPPFFNHSEYFMKFTYRPFRYVFYSTKLAKYVFF